jgi:hypothetical protein
LLFPVRVGIHKIIATLPACMECQVFAGATHHPASAHVRSGSSKNNGQE